MPKFYLYSRKSTDEEDRQVLSIESQINELREFAQREGLQIIEEFTEAKTAKAPGRPIFGFMLKQIENGKADGILAWHPDRLARNSVDGGKIIYLVDIGKIIDLRFPTYRFDNTAQGKFMLSIAFGQSKYYVDNLSENVKRGLREKLRRGIWPGWAPLGYLNDYKTHEVIVDSKKAPFVRKMFEAYAKGTYSIADLCAETHRWGLSSRTGNPIRKSMVGFMLRNPFYYGMMNYKGELHEGIHPPLISKKLFDTVQRELQRRTKLVKPSENKFTFIGLMKCGECGASITAERQKGHIYYRCTKKVKPCKQKFLREEALLEQINKAILKVFIDDNNRDEIFSYWDRQSQDARKASFSSSRDIEIKISKHDQRIERLIDLYIDRQLTEAEYQHKKAKLLNEKQDLVEKLHELKKRRSGWLEPAKEFISLCNAAGGVAWQGNLQQKRDFIKNNGSNHCLKDKNLSFSWTEPFSIIAKNGAQKSKLPI